MAAELQKTYAHHGKLTTKDKEIVITGPLSNLIMGTLTGVFGLKDWQWLFIGEAAPTAGLSQTSTVSAGRNWSGTRLVAPKAATSGRKQR